MLCDDSSVSERLILATIVLYGRSPAESQSFCSFIHILEANPDLASHFSLVVYDNSPERQPIQPATDIPLTYIHQPNNAGLAAAYNFALERAQENGHEWLLLLDQDTTLSLSFFKELTECVSSLRGERDVGSIVPKLTLGGKILSPQPTFINQVRHQYLRSYGAVKHDLIGIQQQKLAAYNSGAALRIEALKSIGGFPEKFWLDYLDHAVFHALSTKNYHMYVMHTEIEHEPSQARLKDVPEWRQRNILLAQTLFIKQAGSFLDLILYRFWILRYSRSLWLRSPHRRLWKEALLHAVFLRTQDDRPLKS